MNDHLVLERGDLSVAHYEHPFFCASAWLVMNQTHAILIDTASNNNADGDTIAQFVRQSGRQLQAIVLSHGHPDVFLGLRRLHASFPDADVFVADAAIVDDIVEMAGTLEGLGLLEDADLSPSQFDYRGTIGVLPEGGLELRGDAAVTLRPWVTTSPTEFTRLTCLWMDALDALFVSDLAYNQVHSWAGIGVDRDALEHWRAVLPAVAGAHPGHHVRVLPGHGPIADLNVLHAQRAYLSDLTGLLDDGVRGDALEEAMTARYPGHRGAGFQLHMTATNPAFAG